MARELEQWGGEVRLPGWLRRVLRRPPPPEDSAERRQEGPEAQPTVSVGQNADRASVGVLTEMYHEGRKKKRR